MASSRILDTGERTPARSLGIATIALAIGFNVPYAVLATTYDYPAVLRGPAASALDHFAVLGAPVILAWHAFALAAFALIPIAIALSITPHRLRTRPAMAITAALSGALAGLAQAIGLWRWVFVVPELARRHADPSTSPAVRAAAENAFELLNAYGGVAIGEHIGQLLTAMFVALLAMFQWCEERRRTATLGWVTVVLIGAGANEGLAYAIVRDGTPFSTATIFGFAALTGWLLATGFPMITANRSA